MGCRKIVCGILHVAVAAVLSHAMVSVANEAAASGDTDVLDELSLGDLLTMEISTGSFLDLDLKKSPLSMTIISHDMVRASGARHMSELLDIYVPGFVYNFNKWNGTVWGMRGVSNDRNTKVIYLVNGHKMNTQSRDGFQSETVLGLLGDIERVEVLRGPAGLVYGTGAIAGIVNVVTRKATDNSSSVSLRGGSDGARSLEGTVYSLPGEGQQLTISAGYLENEGWKSPQTRLYGRAAWPGAPGTDAGGPGEGWYGRTPGNWKLALDFSSENFSFYSRMTRQYESAAPFFIYDPWPEITGSPGESDRNGVVDGISIPNDDPFWVTTESYRNSMRMYQADNLMMEGKYTLALGENSLRVKAGFDRTTTRVREDLFGPYANDNAYRTGRINETFGDTRYCINSTYMLHSVSQLQAALGLELRADVFGNDMDGNNRMVGNDRQYVVYDTTYYTASLFGEGFYDITDKVGVHGGLRLDVHTHAVMLNPKVAAIFRPGDDHSFKLIYQSASNNGSVDNYEYTHWFVGSDGVVNKKPVPDNENQDPDSIDHSNPTAHMIQAAPTVEELHRLKPETVHSVELAYVGKFLDGVTVEPSVAWGKIVDLFGWSQQLYRVINVGQYEYVNADLDVKYTTSNLQIGVAHTVQRPVRTDPDEQADTLNMWAYHQDGEGHWGYPDGVDVDGDTIYKGNFRQNYPVEVNAVKNSVTYDGRHFMSLPDHMTKLYAIYSPVSWMSISSTLRLIWGVKGMGAVINSNDPGVNGSIDSSNYFGYYHERNGQSLKDFIMRSVSKKWNIGFSFYLPKGLDMDFFVYNILGTDNHTIDGNLDRNTVNTLRMSQTYELGHRELYSVDQRSFSLIVTKKF